MRPVAALPCLVLLVASASCAPARVDAQDAPASDSNFDVPAPPQPDVTGAADRVDVVPGVADAAPDATPLLDAAVDAPDARPDDAGCADARACAPPFEGTSRPLPPDVRARMTGVSWRAGCPVGLDALALLEMTHWGFDGAVHRGQMVVAAAASRAVLDVFRRMYDARFPIERVRLVDEYGGDDDRSMADNNTSAFNCRRVTGGTSFSQHSYGDAIDINPVQNPYVSGATVLPPAGTAYTDRARVRPGMIVDPGPVVAAFRVYGWGWGGTWTRPRDYQHFSSNGR